MPLAFGLIFVVATLSLKLRNKMAINYFIFDMDGTLYDFDSSDFKSSKFYNDAKGKIYEFFMRRFDLLFEESKEMFEELNKSYNGEVSIGVEKEYGIDRYAYFAETFGHMKPEDYIRKNPEVKKLFEDINGKAAILTAAPRVWAEKVLRYLDVYELVKDALFTGEPDTRKPDIMAFQEIVDFFGVPPKQIYSIGDQEHSDILPAKNLGMKTIIVGKSRKADLEARSFNDVARIIRRLK